MGHKQVWSAQNITEEKGEILIFFLICILINNKLFLISTLQYLCPGPVPGPGPKNSGPGPDLGQSSQNCMFCGQNNMLHQNMTLCNILYFFWHLEVFYHHKNFIGSNYTLYTIVYNNWFYIIYTRKIQVFLRLWSGFFMYFCIRQPVAAAVHPKRAKKIGLDWTLKH